DTFTAFREDGLTPELEGLPDERLLALYQQFAMRAALEEFAEDSAEYDLMLMIFTTVHQRGLTVLESDDEAKFTQQASAVISEIQNGLNHQSTGAHEEALQFFNSAEKLLNDLPQGVSRNKDADILSFGGMIATGRGAILRDRHDYAGALEFHDLTLQLALTRSDLLSNEVIFVDASLQYVTNVLGHHPDKALQRLLPLVRQRTAGRPCWERVASHAILGSAYWNLGDRASTIDRMGKMQADMIDIQFPLPEKAEAQEVLDRLVDIADTAATTTVWVSIFSTLNKVLVQRSSILFMLDEDAEIHMNAMNRLAELSDIAIARGQQADAETFSFDNPGIFDPKGVDPVKLQPIDRQELDRFALAEDQYARGMRSHALVEEFLSIAHTEGEASQLRAAALHQAGQIQIELGETAQGRGTLARAISAAQKSMDISKDAEVTLELVLSDPENAHSDSSRRLLLTLIDRIEDHRAKLNTAYLQSSFMSDKYMPYNLAIFQACKAEKHEEMLATMELLKSRDIHGPALHQLTDQAPVATLEGLSQALHDEKQPEVRAGIEEQRRLAWDEAMMARPRLRPQFSLVGLQAILGGAVIVNYYNLADEVFLVSLISADLVLTERVMTTERQDFHLALDAVLQMDERSYGMMEHLQCVSDVLLPIAFEQHLLGADQVIVAPHQKLHAVPFGALPVGGRALLHNCPVGNVPNLSVLLKDPPQPADKKSCCGIGTCAAIDKNGTATAPLANAEN
ncbi:MAG: hypothetical protein ABJR23_16850, partial [Paracoccaceae bacterium]